MKTKRTNASGSGATKSAGAGIKKKKPLLEEHPIRKLTDREIWELTYSMRTGDNVGETWKLTNGMKSRGKERAKKELVKQLTNKDNLRTYFDVVTKIYSDSIGENNACEVLAKAAENRRIGEELVKLATAWFESFMPVEKDNPAQKLPFWHVTKFDTCWAPVLSGLWKAAENKVDITTVAPYLACILGDWDDFGHDDRTHATGALGFAARNGYDVSCALPSCLIVIQRDYMDKETGDLKDTMAYLLQMALRNEKMQEKTVLAFIEAVGGDNAKDPDFVKYTTLKYQEYFFRCLNEALFQGFDLVKRIRNREKRTMLLETITETIQHVLHSKEFAAEAGGNTAAYERKIQFMHEIMRRIKERMDLRDIQNQPSNADY